jgi:hypothetical protein
MSNEKEIRAAAKKFLTDNFENCCIIDEFIGGSMIARTDLTAIVNNKIVMCEIKSDSDNFQRLEKQLNEYSKVSHHVYLFVDKKHVETLRNKFLKGKYYSNITALIYDNDEFLTPHGLQKFTFRKPCFKELTIDIFRLLWKEEMSQFLYPLSNRCSPIGTMVVIEDYIFSIYTPKEIINLSLEILLSRWKILAGERFNGYCGRLTSEIEDIEYKKERYKKLCLTKKRKDKK